MGHAEHGHAVFGQADHGVQHFLDHLGVEGRGGLVKQHDLGGHAQRTGNGHALLLAARQLAGVLVGLVRNAHPRQVVHCALLRLGLAQAARAHRRQHAVLHNRQMREQVELLEHHAHFLADGVDGLAVTGQVRAVHGDLALLDGFEPVDAADHRGLARARRPADDDTLASTHVEVDIGQHLEVAIPFLDALEANDGCLRGGRHKAVVFKMIATLACPS